MNKLLLALAISSTISLPALAAPEKVCKVEVCNKLERFTLDLGSLLMDHLGETCQDVILDKKLAVEGKVLNSESRWYQGTNINPTKKSVTRVKKVYQCFTIKS